MIYRKIRLISLKRLLCAAVLLFLTCGILYHIPFFDVLWPAQIQNPAGIIELYQEGITYVELTADTLYYTGYDYVENGRVTGSYYYNLYDGTCIFFLLPISQCNGQAEILYRTPVKARLQSGGKLLQEMISQLSADLSWTPQGLASVSSRVIINAVDYLLIQNLAFWSVSLIVFVISLLVFLNELSYLLFPMLHPACFRLRRYGPVREQALRAEKELREIPVLTRGIFTITEHYLIASSSVQLYILPLDKIVWAYKHSVRHRFHFRRVHITYTLQVAALKRLTLVAAVQPKEDVDAVLDCIGQMVPDVLLHYTRENERLARIRCRM